MLERARPSQNNHRFVRAGASVLRELGREAAERTLPNFLAAHEDQIRSIGRSAVRNGKESLIYLLAERPFIPLDPPLTHPQMLQREAVTMDGSPPEGNWMEDHTMPSPDGHYAHRWKWDSKDAVKINTSRAMIAHKEGHVAERDRLLDKAAAEFKSILSVEDPNTGFIPNMSYNTASGRTWHDVEAWTFPRPDIGSGYGQPPVLAGAAWDLYEAFEKTGQGDKGMAFLSEVYGTKDEGNYVGLRGEFAYWAEQRQNSNTDPLLFVIHPHETGRDSDPAIKPGALILPVNGKVTGFINSLIDYGGILRKGWKNGKNASDPEGQRIDWLPEEVRKDYAVNDVMFNVLYTQNLRYMGKIAEKLGNIDDSEEYKGLAGKVEHEILTRTWDPDKKFFYNLDSSGNQIPQGSVTGLFPLLLDGIPGEQVGALLDKLEDEEWFRTPYPIPSLPVNSPHYDGDYRMKSRLWRGPVWVNASHYIADEGLAAQAKRFEETDPYLAVRCMWNAKRIVELTQQMLGINPHTNEFYNPETGQGYRIDGFMWTGLGLHFDKYDAIKSKYDLAV